MAAILLTINTLGSVASAVAHPLAVVPETERLPGRSPAAINAPASQAGVSAVRSLGGQPLGEISAPPAAPSVCIAMTAGQGWPICWRGDSRTRRGPAYGPVVLEGGEAAFDTTGVTHWWRNETSKPARALVVDIVEESSP